MKYLGLCDKYGMATMFLASHALPGAITLAAATYTSHSPTLKLIFGVAGMIIGNMGAVKATHAHQRALNEAAEQHMGLTRGGAYVRMSQLKAYSKTTAIGLTLAFAGYAALDAANTVLGEDRVTKPGTVSKAPIRDHSQR